MPPFPSSSMSPSAPYSPAYSHQVNGPRSAIYSGAGRLQAHQVHHSIDYSPSPGRHLSNTTSKYHMHGMKSEEIAGHDDEFNYARRRSVSSPSKIRMYTTARTLGADWTGAEVSHMHSLKISKR